MAATDDAFAAHLLRRTRFYVTRPLVQQLATLSRDAMIGQVVDSALPPKVPANPGLRNLANKAKDRDFSKILLTELNRLNSPKSGLGDRMLWFWHGFLTTGMDKVDQPGLLWRQHRLLATHALGNFRQLLIELTTDPAMLFYLDGDGSNASEGNTPNENYARELMELFSLGRTDASGNANYSQDDVIAASKALAGWYVNFRDKGHYNPNRIKGQFDTDSAYVGTINFLGKSIALDPNVSGPDRVKAIVDQILTQPAAALYIVRKLFVYFVHASPSNETLNALAETFRSHNFEILPVLKQLFRLDEFQSAEAMAGRARLPLEWAVAMLSASQLPAKAIDFQQYFNDASQTPFDPPNVAGWTVGDRWLSVTQALARAKVAVNAFDFSKRHKLLKQLNLAADPVSDLTQALSLYDLSEQTRSQLAAMLANDKAKTLDQPMGPARAILALALSSPEFALT